MHCHPPLSFCCAYSFPAMYKMQLLPYSHIIPTVITVFAAPNAEWLKKRNRFLSRKIKENKEKKKIQKCVPSYDQFHVVPSGTVCLFWYMLICAIRYLLYIFCVTFDKNDGRYLTLPCQAKADRGHINIEPMYDMHMHMHIYIDFWHNFAGIIENWSKETYLNFLRS